MVVDGGSEDVVDVGRGSVVAGVSVVEGATDVAGTVVGADVSVVSDVAGAGGGGMVSATLEDVEEVDGGVVSVVVGGGWLVVDGSTVDVVV
jgi:hypothetical protein